MVDTIKEGTVLIKQGAILPETLAFVSTPYELGWRFVRNLNGYGLGRKIRDAGWTFFYLAGQIETKVFGFDGQKTLRRAIRRLLARLKTDDCNSLEVTKVVSKRFLGLPYVSVTAHSRHIQEGLVLFQPTARPKWVPQRRMAA